MAVPISITSLTKVFGAGKTAATAVDGIDLDVEPGELFFLLGPSGCGKTTLLRMIAGFEEPTSGVIRFGDRDVTHVGANKRNTGMVFQSYALWPHMTVEANVAFGLGVRRIGRKERQTRVREALDAVQMGQYAKRKPNQLSGGQQQRVALARAMVIRPDVLLLDEPLSNLDAKLRNELRVEIRRICKEAGMTTVYVTHDQKEALSMADRIAVLKDGRVIQLGDPLSLYRRPSDRFVAGFLGETNFISGVVTSVTGDLVEITTSIGALRGVAIGEMQQDDRVVASVRPESLRPHSDGAANTIEGVVTQFTYLGETAHSHVDAGHGVNLSVSTLNPGQRAETGGAVRLSVDVDDVVVIRDQAATPSGAARAAAPVAIES